MEIFTSGWPLLAVASLFGLLVGSFLNVVILRLPARLQHDWCEQCREILAEDAAMHAVDPAPAQAEAPQAEEAEADAALVGEAAMSDPGDEPDVPAGTATALVAPAALQNDVDLLEPVPASTQAASVADPGEPSQPDQLNSLIATDVPPDIVFVPSHCPKCKHLLSAYDNIPLLSWLFLGGRCRYCKTPISIQYPLIEALSALCAFAVAWQFGYSWQAAAGLVLGFSLIALSGIDFHTKLLPDNITLPLLWGGLLLSLFPLFVTPQTAIVGAAVGYLSLWSVYWGFKLLTGKEGMGHGDFKLLAALGAWMGPMALLPIILLSSLLGAVVGSIALAVQGRDRSSPIPFGPFIAIAGWLQFIWGNEMAELYGQYFLLQ